MVALALVPVEDARAKAMAMGVGGSVGRSGGSGSGISGPLDFIWEEFAFAFGETALPHQADFTP